MCEHWVVVLEYVIVPMGVISLKLISFENFGGETMIKLPRFPWAK